MIQLDGSVVQHQTRTDDLAGLVWCHTQLAMEAVPSPLHHANTSFDGGSCDAVCIIERLFFRRLWTYDWCQQPVTQHVATVSKNVS